MLPALEGPGKGILVSTRELEKTRSREQADQEGCRCSVADNADTSILET